MVRTGRMWRMIGAAGIGGAGLLAAVAPVGQAVAAPVAGPLHPVAIVSTPTGFAFRPRMLRIPSGQSVKWTNRSQSSHTVTRCTVAACGVSGGTGTDPGPSSPTLNAGGTYQLKFTGKGTYVYYCQIHGFAVMHGTITVK